MISIRNFKKLNFYVVLFSIVSSIIMNFSYINSENNKFVIGARKGCGLFSDFFTVINNLRWAEKNNKTPVVYWGKDSSYYQDKTYNGKSNAWEYYFYPISKLSYKGDEKIFNGYEDPNGEFIFYGISDVYELNINNRILYNSYIKKYIKIQSNIQNRIDQFYSEKMKGKKNIGIHLRGTNKFWEVLPVNPLCILKKAKELDKNNEYQIFIATDEEKLLKFAEDFFKDKTIIYYNSQRSIDGTPLYFYKDKSNPLLGEEVLIETVLLSKCDFLLHPFSNVSYAACSFNPYIFDFLFYNDGKNTLCYTPLEGKIQYLEPFITESFSIEERANAIINNLEKVDEPIRSDILAIAIKKGVKEMGQLHWDKFVNTELINMRISNWTLLQHVIWAQSDNNDLTYLIRLLLAYGADPNITSTDSKAMSWTAKTLAEIRARNEKGQAHSKLEEIIKILSFHKS